MRKYLSLISLCLMILFVAMSLGGYLIAYYPQIIYYIFF